jgi:hypothetical protein
VGWPARSRSGHLPDGGLLRLIEGVVKLGPQEFEATLRARAEATKEAVRELVSPEEARVASAALDSFVDVPFTPSYWSDMALQRHTERSRKQELEDMAWLRARLKDKLDKVESTLGADAVDFPPADRSG